MLTDIYNWFTEGCETDDLKGAKGAARGIGTIHVLLEVLAENREGAVFVTSAAQSFLPDVRHAERKVASTRDSAIPAASRWQLPLPKSRQRNRLGIKFE